MITQTVEAHINDAMFLDASSFLMKRRSIKQQKPNAKVVYVKQHLQEISRSKTS